ncbi:DNA polymerase III subunit delta [Chlorobaculum sp. MV4-Y]|uniref:DNA polymerase III subunit delta n=1 Tax=Chlorobaculum sp. MV4-Y TaxID=2976335 RepID=UPI0021B03835|nr:DNA polymerase III subunit delta [Chlorobaculum sp. MV4-Y]UWX57344.1 DNA polymerase III subunit delta [Chlorobaculum sp. MV4-Y]
MADLKKQITSGKIAPVYFFYGPESWLKEEIETQLKAAIFPSENEAALNTLILYGPDLSLGQIVSAASEYPMFTEKKLVIVRQFDKLKKVTGKMESQRQEESLLSYLSDPPSFTVLVLDADEIEKKELEKAPYKHLKAFRHDFGAIKNADLFAAERAKEAGWEFEPDALKTFSAYIEPSSRLICQEIEKLTLYASNKRPDRRITLDDVCDCVGISRKYNVFELEKALVGKNLRQCSGIALMIMEQEGQKEGLMNIVRYLTTFFLRIWKLQAPGAQQLSLQETAAMLGMYGRQEYFAKNFIGYARQFSTTETEKAILALRDADAALKGIIPSPDDKFTLLKLMQQLFS